MHRISRKSMKQENSQIKSQYFKMGNIVDRIPIGLMQKRQKTQITNIRGEATDITTGSTNMKRKSYTREYCLKK